MGRTALDEFLPLLVQMYKDPPDPNAIPTLNRRDTAMGLTIPFHILSWIAVWFRLHTRFFVVRDPGWDDFFVVAAAVLNLISMVAFLMGLQYGLGLHIIYALPTLEVTMIWFYIASATYTSMTMFIKLSLLCQYLRLFRKGYRRTIVIFMLVIVSIWGAVYSFMAWFPCFPVQGFWNKQMSPPAICYGFGYHTVGEVKATLISFSGSNMCLDFLILMIPLTEYFKPNLRRKEVLAMTGLFAFGSLVVLMAILRLWTGLRNKDDELKMFDFTFWFPEVLIFSCLEIDFAIMCASMPIFWPTITAAWTEIFVTKEVHVTRDQRSVILRGSHSHYAMDTTHSLKSYKSTEGLAHVASQEAKSFFLEFDPESGMGPGQGINEVDVKSQVRKY